MGVSTAYHLARRGAGAWSGEVGRPAGSDVPVRPLCGSKFITAPVPFARILEATPFILHTHQGIPLRREGEGLLLGIDRRDEPSAFRRIGTSNAMA